MDNRRTVIIILLLMPILIFWKPLTDALFQKLGYDVTPPITQTTPSATTNPSTSQQYTAASTQPGAATSFSPGTAPSMAAAPLRVAPATQPKSSELGSTADNSPDYSMGVSLVPRGAGIDSIVLNQYKREAKSKLPYIFQQPYAEAEATSRPLATQSITIDGNTVDLSRVDWNLEKFSPNNAVYSVTIVSDAGPQVRVLKEYRLPAKSDPSSGYELSVTQTVENLADQPIKVETKLAGPNLPPRESDRSGERYVIIGYDDHSSIETAHDSIESFAKDNITRTYTKDKSGNPLMWAGSASAYFNALIRPLPITGDPKSPPSYISKFTATTVNPDAPRAEDHDIATAIATNELTVAPRQSLVIPIRAFFGPRERQLLNDSYYSTFPLSYNETLVLTAGLCGICTFQPLITALVYLLAFFHSIFRDWGLAIIALVVLVRAMLHPITKRSQISMSKMTKMGPEMQRLKDKYGDNKDELNKAMMQFYKEQGVTPILGCLPMVLQMPIWIALWQALQTTFQLRQAPFLWGYTWIHDLSQPDHLIKFNQAYDFFFLHISGLNILPLLMAVAFFVQARMQPRPATETPEQAQQRKMMQWMTLLFPVMLYSGPSGLNLYIMTSTAIGVVEQKIVRDHIKQREEAEKAGRVIVDAGRKFKGGGTDLKKKPAQPEKKGGILGWFAELQAKADQVRRDAEKKK